MYRCYTGAQIRSAEQPRLAAGEGPTLMRTAAWGLAHHTLELLRNRGAVYGSPDLGLVGKGNNGGDTLWALSFLAVRGVAISAAPVHAERTDLHADGFAASRRAGGRFVQHIVPVTDVVSVGLFSPGMGGA